MNRVKNHLLLVLSFLLITSCASIQPIGSGVDNTGTVIAQADWPDNVSSNVSTVRMTVSSSGMETVTQDFVFTGERREIYGIHGVAAGDNRSIILQGLASNNMILFEGSLPGISIVPGQVIDSGLITMSPALASPLSNPEIRVEAGNGKVTIMWDSMSGADSYNIYMNTSRGTSKKNFDARKFTTNTSYTWTGLQNGATYFFAVTAENNSGESGDSNEASSTPGIISKSSISSSGPAAPTNVTAEAGNGKVKIMWDSVSGADQYSIYMNGSPGILKRNFDARKLSTTNSYTWEGLNNGTIYYFAVAAENSSGESKNSHEFHATPGTSKPATEASPVSPEIPVKVPKKVPEVPMEITMPEIPKETPGAAISPEKLLLIADNLRAPGKNFVQDLTITFKKEGKESVNKTSVRVKDFNKSLVIYKYPATQKGRVILMVDTNMWIYFPGTKKPVRISPAQQLLGQVSNADVARVVYNYDYKAERVEDDNSGKEPLLKLFLKAKTKGAAYGSINLWMAKGSNRLVKAEFFTLSERLLKTIFYKGYKPLLGKERPTILEVHDAIKKSEVTIMEYTSMKVEDTPDNNFQKTFMQRIPSLYQ